VNSHQSGPGFLANSECIAKMIAMIMSDNNNISLNDLIGGDGRHRITREERVDDDDFTSFKLNGGMAPPGDFHLTPPLVVLDYTDSIIRFIKLLLIIINNVEKKKTNLSAEPGFSGLGH
jgi:hypothetical protein